jgi:outer membrane protein
MFILKRRLAFLLVSVLAIAPTVSAEPKDLQQLFLSALDTNPTLRIARYNVEIGKAQQSQASGQMLPQISMSASFSDNEQEFIDSQQPVTEFDGEKYAIQLRQVLFDWQVFANRKKASFIVDQRRADYYEQLSAILLETAGRYFLVLAAEDKLALVKAEREATDQQLKQSEAHYKRKLIRVTDLYENRARAASIKTNEIDAEHELAIAREALWEISGEEIGELKGLSDGVKFPVIQDGIEVWVDRALGSNHQLRSRQSAVDAALQAVSERRGSYYPKVSFVASRQKSDLGYENTPSERRLITYFGVDITIPIFSGGSTSARTREAHHLAGIAKSEFDLTRRDVVKQTRAAYLSANSSLDRIDAGLYAVASAEESALAMDKGFKVGAVTTTDVLNSIQQNFSAKRDLQQAKYDYIKYKLSLERTAGSLDINDIEQINSWLVAPLTP